MRRNGYSRAFRDFEVSHRRPQTLLRIEISLYKDPPPQVDQAAVAALRGGATVLLVACIEQYLKSAFEEFVEHIERKALVTSNPLLPPGFDSHNDFQYLQAAIKSRRSKLEKIIEVRRIAALIASSKFVPESFSQTQANPGPVTVSTLFKEFGIQNPLNVIETNLVRHYKKPFAPGFVSSQLEDLVSARNQVAHGEYSLNKSRNDIQAWVEFAYSFAKAADNTIRDRAAAITSVL